MLNSWVTNNGTNISLGLELNNQGARDFRTICESKFSGAKFYTQLILRGAQSGALDYSTDGEELDNTVEMKAGNGNHTAIVPYFLMQYFDNPGIEMKGSSASIRDQLKAYIRFTPTGEGSISITLGVLRWNWLGIANKTGGQWQTDSRSFVSPVETDFSNHSFPSWEKVHGNIGNSIPPD